VKDLNEKQWKTIHDALVYTKASLGRGDEDSTFRAECEEVLRELND
jgi:hypothetical protein